MAVRAMNAQRRRTSATGMLGSGAPPEPQNARPWRSLQAPDARAVRPSIPDRYQRMKAPRIASGTSRPQALREVVGAGAIERITDAINDAGGAGERSALIRNGKEIAWSCWRRQSAQPTRWSRTACAPF